MAIIWAYRFVSHWLVSLPRALMSCVQQTKPDLRKRYPKASAKEITSKAFAICISRTGQKPHREAVLLSSKIMEIVEESILTDFDFYFNTAIKEVTKESIGEESADLYTKDEMILEGIAINATITKNWRYYPAEELKPSANTLIGVPIVLDHKVEAGKLVGKVKEAWWSETEKHVFFRGGIDKNDPIAQKIKLGYLASTSVGGHAKSMTCSICEEPVGWFHDHQMGKTYEGKTAFVILKGVVFAELTLTPSPADVGAQFAVASSFSNAMDVMVEHIENPTEDTLVRATQVQGFSLEETNRAVGRLKNILENTSGTPSKNPKIGESVLPDPPPDPNEIRESEKLRVKLEESDKKLKESLAKVTDFKETQKELEKLKEEKHKLLVQECMDTEMQLGRLKEEGKSDRAKALLEWTDERLAARLEALRELAPKTPAAPTSRSIIDPTTGPAPQLTEEAKKEFKISKLSQALGYSGRFSATAVETAKDFNENTGKWESLIDISRLE